MIAIIRNHKYRYRVDARLVGNGYVLFTCQLKNKTDFVSFSIPVTWGLQMALSVKEEKDSPDYKEAQGLIGDLIPEETRKLIVALSAKLD